MMCACSQGRLGGMTLSCFALHSTFRIIGSKNVLLTRACQSTRRGYLFNNRRLASSIFVEEPSSVMVEQQHKPRQFPVPAQIHSSLSRGCIDYIRGWAWQSLLLHRRLISRRRSDDTNQEEDLPPFTDPDVLLLLEHHSVYTLGRGANEKHLTFLLNKCSDNRDCEANARQRLARSYRGDDSARLSVDRQWLETDLLLRPEIEAVELLCQRCAPVVAPNGAPIYRVERGGEVTYHGPGQLVVYPMLDLKRYNADLHWFLRMVEEVIIETLREYDIVGVRDEINTGVWVHRQKVAAVGVSSSRWITTHGFALNVCSDLSFFDASVIVPCGINGRTVTSIGRILQSRGETRTPTVQEVAEVIVEKMTTLFELELQLTKDIF